MLNDRDYELISKTMIELYSEIERELLVNIAKRFILDDKIGGSLEWQLKKLDDLGGLNAENLKVIAKYSGRSEQELRNAIQTAGIDGIDMDTLNEAYDKELINKNPESIFKAKSILNVINNSYKDTNKLLKLIQTKALESAKKEYINVLNTTYLEVSSGIYDYGTSIRKALKKMADNGISGATYVREDGTIVNYSIEAAVRRDVLTAVNQTANKISEATVNELDAEYVEVSAHLGARPTHAVWQGKVYKLNGRDEQYQNLAEATGYGQVDGLGGVNCRHHMYPFFPGISTPTTWKIDPEENERLYELTKQQRALERNVRKYKKRQAVAEAVGEDDMTIMAKNEVKNRQRELREFLKENPDLQRDYSREKVDYRPKIEYEKVKVDIPNVPDIKVRGINRDLVNTYNEGIKDISNRYPIALDGIKDITYLETNKTSLDIYGYVQSGMRSTHDSPGKVRMYFTNRKLMIRAKESYNSVSGLTAELQSAYDRKEFAAPGIKSVIYHEIGHELEYKLNIAYHKLDKDIAKMVKLNGKIVTVEDYISFSDVYKKMTDKTMTKKIVHNTLLEYVKRTGDTDSFSIIKAKTISRYGSDPDKPGETFAELFSKVMNNDNGVITGIFQEILDNEIKELGL
jgi:hypothetical protein